MRNFKNKILMVNGEYLLQTESSARKGKWFYEGKVHESDGDYLAKVEIYYMSTFRQYGAVVYYLDDEQKIVRYYGRTCLTRRGAYAFLTYFIDLMNPTYLDFIVRTYKNANFFLNKRCSTAEYCEEKIKQYEINKRRESKC